MNLNGEAIYLMDTTLRDGEQTQGVSFTPSEKTNIAKALLNTLRVDRIEIASARVSNGEKQAVKNITDWAKKAGFLEKVEVLGFVDQAHSVDWICETGGKVMNLLTKGSEKHCHQQLHKSLQDHLRDIRNTIAYAHEQGLKVNVYLEDWSNGYYHSPQYVYALIEGIKDCKIQHFMLPDTLGILSPDQVYESLTEMTSRFSWANFDFHAHNDYGLAVANALFAVKAGVRNLHCTINCLGERAGNVSLAEIAVVLKDKINAMVSIDESKLATISETIESFSGKKLANNSPIVGEDVFTQTSGIHADGDKKGGLYHNPILPERFGRKRNYALGKLSGKASLQKNLEQLGLQLTEANFHKVLKRITELGDSKETITQADLPFIVTDILENTDSQRVKLLSCCIHSTLDSKEMAKASIHIQIDERDLYQDGKGTGGYDAFMNALRKILKCNHLECPELIDYQIRIPRGGRTDALTKALITWKAGANNRIQTVGVDGDQVMAAVNATMKMINLTLIDGVTFDSVEESVA